MVFRRLHRLFYDNCAIGDEKSVGGGDVVGCLVSLRVAGCTVGGQTGVADLVQQSAVADVQCASGLFAVPMMMLENFEDDLALQFTNGLARDFLQRDWSLDGNVGIEEIRF